MANLRKGIFASRGRMVVASSLTAAAIAVSAPFIYPALATPGSGFGPPIAVSVGHFGALDIKADKAGKWDLFLKSKDDTIVSTDILVVKPDGQSGWHTHAGPILVTVTKGSISWQDGVDCSTRVYQAGESFIERANQPHLVRFNSAPEGGENAEFVGVQMRPEGTPGRVDFAETPCAN